MAPESPPAHSWIALALAVFVTALAVFVVAMTQVIHVYFVH